MSGDGERVLVSVDGRRLTLSNLDKVLYPGANFHKRDVIDYYSRVASVMLPYLERRAATFVRYPDGVSGKSFFEKDVSRHAPDWVRTARLTTRSRAEATEVNRHPLVNDLPTLVWAANLAALEIHVPQWRLGPRDVRRNPDLLVFDLDPGPPADIVDCCRVAERLVDLLHEDGLTPYPKTSGGKGMQLYCGVRTRRPEHTSDYAKRIAERLAEDDPRRVTAKMSRSVRQGKVFIDWSQNSTSKTTVAPYSLRGRTEPTGSTPLGWDEVRDCRAARELSFTSSAILRRLDEHGDLFAPVLTERATPPSR